MFVRDYICASGHRTEHFHHGTSATAPVVIPCGAGTCELPAEARIAAHVPKPGPLGELAQEYRRRGMAPRGA